MGNYYKNENLTAMGEDVLKTYHEDKVGKARFVFVFKDPPAKNSTGAASKVSGLNKALGVDADFVITISHEPWRAMSDEQRRALLDHLLCRCDVVQDEKKGGFIFSMRQHDLVMFHEELERHGAWSAGIQKAIATAKQMKLFK